MRRFFAALLFICLLPAAAWAEIRMTELADSESGSRLVVFEARADAIELEAGKEPAPDPVLMAINAQIEVRFAQEKAMIAMGRAGATVRQSGSLYQDGSVASMGLLWQGEQADGMEGSSAFGLTVNLDTGAEIYLDEVLTDYDGALAAMEAIIERDVLDGMSDYMEYADLLPMPTDSWYFDEYGLTICWPEDRYRYYDGASGSVTFYWHELADFIGEESPVYALSRIPAIDVQALRDMLRSGGFEWLDDCRIDDKLGQVEEAYHLADPDYTTDALVYPLERIRDFAAFEGGAWMRTSQASLENVRGYAIEIPKYAETAEAETPVSAIRASRISVGGLTTGRTTPEDVYPVFGEPNLMIAYDEDAALDAMLEPGESLFFADERNVLQLHFNEAGVLSCLIIRKAMPESLY